MSYEYRLLNPSGTQGAEIHNRQILHPCSDPAHWPQVLGIGLPVEIAGQPTIGNIGVGDALKMRANDQVFCDFSAMMSLGTMLELALLWPLQVDGTTLAIWPSDDPYEMLDRLAAAATLSIKRLQRVHSNEECGGRGRCGARDRVQVLLDAIKARNEPWKPRALPSSIDEWPGPWERAIASAIEICTTDTPVNLVERIDWLTEWLALGSENTGVYLAGDAVDRERAGLIEALESGRIQIALHPSVTERCDICLSERGTACGHAALSAYCDTCGALANSQCVCERVAVIESSHAESIELGFRLAPIVIRVITDIECMVCERTRTRIEPPCSFCASDEQPHVERCITISVWPGHWAEQQQHRLALHLSDLEPIWEVDGCGPGSTGMTKAPAEADCARLRTHDCPEAVIVQLEQGWTVQGNRILSPSGRSTDLSVEQIIKIIREVTE